MYSLYAINGNGIVGTGLCFLEGVYQIWVLKNERYLTPPIRIPLTSQLTDVRHVWLPASRYLRIKLEGSSYTSVET